MRAVKLKTYFILFFLFTCGFLVKTVKCESNNKIYVFAASSLTDVLNKVCKKFEDENKCIIILNLDSSGRLYRQIKQGAPVNVFISANKKFIEDSKKEKLIIADTITPLAENKLVVITNKKNNYKINSIADISEIKTDIKIAIAQTETVPAGIYAKQALEKSNIWKKINSLLNVTIVQGNNVRAVMAYVEKEETEFGFVYLSDTYVSKKIKTIYEVKETLHDKIILFAAVVNSSDNKEMSKKFVEFLKTEYCQKEFIRYGFKKVE